MVLGNTREQLVVFEINLNRKNRQVDMSGTVSGIKISELKEKKIIRPQLYFKWRMF